jgi:hypothetical protein
LWADHEVTRDRQTLGTNEGGRRMVMTTDYGEESVRRFWEEVFGWGGASEMDEMFTTHYRLHDLVHRETHHLEKVKSIVSDSHNMMPAARVVVDDQRMTVDGRVFTHFTVHVPSPPDADPSQQASAPGEGWQYNGMSLSRIVEGEIAESWIVWEVIRAEQELGPYFEGPRWRWPPWR